MSGHVPARRSVLTRDRRPKAELLRIALDPEGRPFVDLLARAPGRGAYVESTRDALRDALSPRGVARAFRGRTVVALEPAEVEEIVKATRSRLEARVLELLSLARRANLVELGLEPTAALLERGAEGAVVVTAEDASARTLGRIDAVFEGYRGAISRVVLPRKAAMGEALGKSELAVLAVRASHLAERIAGEARRLVGFESTAAPAGCID